MAVNECFFGEKIKWIDVKDPTRDEIDAISKEYQFPHHLLSDSLDPDHLPKYDEVHDLHFLIVRFYVHALDRPITTIQELTSKVGIFYNDEFIITIHRNEAHFLKDIKTKYLDTGKITSPTDFVLKILWYVLETFDEPAQRLSEQMDFYERRIILKEIEQGHLEALYLMKRKASLCQKILTLTNEPINHIRTKDKYEMSLDDVKDHQLKVSTLYSHILDNATNLMNLYISFSAQKTSDVMKILTIFSVFFMPLTFIVGIYGMNFDFMPELRERWGYPIVILVMLTVVAIIYSWFKRKKWL